MLLQRGDLKQGQGEGGGEEQPVGGGKAEERSTAAWVTCALYSLSLVARAALSRARSSSPCPEINKTEKLL